MACDAVDLKHGDKMDSEKDSHIELFVTKSLGLMPKALYQALSPDWPLWQYTLSGKTYFEKCDIDGLKECAVKHPNIGIEELIELIHKHQTVYLTDPREIVRFANKGSWDEPSIGSQMLGPKSD